MGVSIYAHVLPDPSFLPEGSFLWVPAKHGLIMPIQTVLENR